MSDEIPKTVFRDADAVRSALFDLRADVVSYRFLSVKVKPLLQACGQANGDHRDTTTKRLVAALTFLNDMDEFQSSTIWKDGRVERVFMRAVDSNTALADVMTTMYGADVQAVCAMVQDGHHGLARLSGLDSSAVLSWTKKGCTNAETVRRLVSIIDHYSRCGSVLIDDPLAIDDFVETAAKKQQERGAKFDALQIVVQEEEEKERDRLAEEEARRLLAEQKAREAEVERLRLQDMLCPVCGLQSRQTDRRLCRSCEDKAITSALGKVDEVGLAPAFEEERDWETQLEKQAARLAYDAGIDDPTDYHAVGVAVADVEALLGEHEMGLADIGIFIAGYNDDPDRPDEPEPQRAQAVDRRRGDGRVLVAGMEFYPHRVRERLKAALESLKVVSGIAETLVEDVETGGELRDALGYEGSQQVSELDARVDEVTRDLKYLRTELVPRTEDERSENRRAR